jgi:transcriptional regulator with XRE-family HTH domain
MVKAVFSDAYTVALAQLVALRKEKGVSQVELARRIGKHQQFVSLVERRERRLDVVEYLVIVRALGGDPIALLGVLLENMPGHLAGSA